MITINITTISMPPPTPAPTNRNPDDCDCSDLSDTAASSDRTAVKEGERENNYADSRSINL
jgi:hypothetical protein